MLSVKPVRMLKRLLVLDLLYQVDTERLESLRKLVYRSSRGSTGSAGRCSLATGTASCFTTGPTASVCCEGFWVACKAANLACSKDTICKVA
jgi:hypothetical protein